MTIPQFDLYWKKVHNQSMFDGNGEYAEWDDFASDQPVKCFGMRHKASGLRHGIVREVHPNGYIEEASFKEGKNCGLVRYVDKESVAVGLWKDGHQLARFDFNQGKYFRFQEIYREDP